MQPWPPPDSHHLLAAQGWLELGNWKESNAELEQLTPEHRAHPDALKPIVSWHGCRLRQCSRRIWVALNEWVGLPPS